jgi:cell shape-determining protein MreC
MILYRRPLIFGFIRKLIKVFSTVLYKILAFFNLQLTLLLALIGLVLYITGIFDKNSIVLIVFYVLLVLSIVYAITGTIKRLLGIEKRVKKSKGAQIINEQVENKESAEQPVNEVKAEQVRKESPTYYTVKQNNNYIMAEYSDRYELYKKTEEGLKKVRTDYK